MAQAQKLVGLAGIERFAGFAGQIAQFDPSVLKKVKAQQMIDVYADVVSIDPSIIRTDEEVQAMEAAEADQALRAQQAQEAVAMANTAKTLSEVPMEGDSALNRMLDVARAGSLG